MTSSNAARAVRGLPTTAAAIRAFGGARPVTYLMSLRALDIRYQHVRNVLIRDEAKARAVEASEPTKIPEKIRVAADGTVVVPAAAINALSLKQGDPLFVRIAEGELHLS